MTIYIDVEQDAHSFELRAGQEGNQVLFYKVTKHYGGDSNNFGSTHRHSVDTDLPPGKWVIIKQTKSSVKLMSVIES